MEHAPHLTRGRAPRRPRGLVLMLHGGAEHGVDPIGARSAPWLRSRLMMAQVQGDLSRADLAVWLLRYRYKGWNPGHEQLPTPVPDARWALDEVRREHGSLPVVLLGHSMGARTSTFVADDESVHGVVGLAPWFPPSHPVSALAGKHLVAAHGRADRITSFAATEKYVHRASAVAASAQMVDMGDTEHYMLKDLGGWNAAAVQHAVEIFDR